MKVTSKEATSLARRSAAEVLSDHLACRTNRELEADIQRNYHVLLTLEDICIGADGIRACAKRLLETLGEASFSFPLIQTHERFCLLEWRGHCGDRIVHDGVDSFVIEHGRIRCQTIRYTVTSKA